MSWDNTTGLAGNISGLVLVTIPVGYTGIMFAPVTGLRNALTLYRTLCFTGRLFSAIAFGGCKYRPANFTGF